MYINFKSKIFTNSIKPNIQDEKVPTLPSHNLEAHFNKFYFNKKNNSRNFNFISLHKTPKNNNIFIHTFSNNKSNTKSDQPKLISSDIKPKNDIKISVFEKNENNSHLNTVGNSYEKSFNKNNNVLLKDSNINKNDESQKKKLDFTNIKEFKKRRRFSVMEIPSNNLDIRKTLFNSNNRRSSITQIRNNNTSKFSKRRSMHFISNPILRSKITELIKDLEINHKTEIKLYEKGEGDIINKERVEKKEIKNKNKTFDSLVKKNRNRFLNLLNKDGSLNSFLKSMKFKTKNTIQFRKFNNKENNMINLIKRPRNTVEMNKLLINSFSLNQDRSTEFSKKLYSLNETFFSVMNELKIAKTEMELKQINKLSEKKNKITPLTVELIQKRERNWERKFLLKKYENKLSEKEFKKFKNQNKIKRKKEINKKSRNLADNLMKMDAREYEITESSNEYKSTGTYFSNININRIRRVKKILKNIDDKEQLGAYDVNVEKLKQNQKESEAESALAVRRAGKPRFVKTQFRTTTIIKYKNVSGENFGLPA